MGAEQLSEQRDLVLCNSAPCPTLCQIITCNSCNPGLIRVRPGLVRVDPGLVREYGVVSLDEVPLRLDLI